MYCQKQSGSVRLSNKAFQAAQILKKYYINFTELELLLPSMIISFNLMKQRTIPQVAAGLSFYSPLLSFAIFPN